MNELDAIGACVASLVAGTDCAICNWLNNLFNNLLDLGIGVAGVGGAVVGTVVSGTTSVGNRVGDAARDARDAFNANYDRTSGGSGSSTTPSGPSQVPGQFPPAFRPQQVQGPFGPVFVPPQLQGPFGPGTAPPRYPWAGFGNVPPSPTGMPQGTLHYFNVGTPTGSQLGGPQ
jgi:hypothetical protein